MVNENVVELPLADAVTRYDPAIAFAVAVTLAMPEALVVAVGADRFALAPDPGAEKDTTAPGIGALLPSFKVTWSPTGKAVLTAVDCGVPAVAVSDPDAEPPKKMPASCAHDPPVRVTRMITRPLRVKTSNRPLR